MNYFNVLLFLMLTHKLKVAKKLSLLSLSFHVKRIFKYNYICLFSAYVFMVLDFINLKFHNNNIAVKRKN